MLVGSQKRESQLVGPADRCAFTHNEDGALEQLWMGDQGGVGSCCTADPISSYAGWSVRG